MKKLILLTTAIFLFTGVAIADWSEGDPYKMHWPQLPDPNGWDVMASEPFIAADDFRCTETGYIKDIHFWGSWMHGFDRQISILHGFWISIHEDIPAIPGDPDSYSMPGQPLLSRFFDIDKFITAGPFQGPQGWWDPAQGFFFPPPDHFEFFQYNLKLPSSYWVRQEKGKIYWLNISAVVEDPMSYPWGWKTTFDGDPAGVPDLRYNDTSVFTDQSVYPGGWRPIYDPFPPPQSESDHLDLAFVITGEPVIPTISPVADTVCPVVVTECPSGKTTICPLITTACPVDPTKCPANVPTVCPVDQTWCPVVDTLCPARTTSCQETACTTAPTICQQLEPTYCPTQEYTICPEKFTICPEIPTRCPDSQPTICKFTLCPVHDTQCPITDTECPDDVTICGPGGTFTICPDIVTQCPTRWTYCPEYPTECPVVETFCPNAGIYTWCPDIAPTVCSSTGGTPTECPVNAPTWCPEVPTKCPQLDTFCPEGIPDLCEITIYPVVDTVCPNRITVCPEPDTDNDGILDSNDNCPLRCNSDQLDADNDGTGDVCDPTPGCGGCGEECEQECSTTLDTDGDGIIDVQDNCPNNCNTEQLDADNDGIGDVCDPDPGCGGCGDPCEIEC